MSDSPTMGHEVLLQGSYYALHLAGELAEEAQILFERHRYSRAFFLVNQAFEELGRSIYLCNFAKDASEGKTVTREMVVGATKRHEAKHGRGRGSITFARSSGTQVEQLTDDMFSRDPKVRWAASDKLKEWAAHELEQRIKRDTQRREEMLYVDPNQDGTGWNRPGASSEEAKLALMDLVNNYSVRAGNFVPGILRERANDTLDKALEDWVARPPLPRLKLAEL